MNMRNTALNLPEPSEAVPIAPGPTPEDIARLDQKLARAFNKIFTIQRSLTRALVSFQANKARPVYRWYKYKEAFSAPLLEYLFQQYGISSGRILDPFAGSGTALFVAAAAGMDADGIELLPIGQQIITTRKLVEQDLTDEDLTEIARWSHLHLWERSEARRDLPELRITRGAYPEQTREAMARYLGAAEKTGERVQAVLRFALLCVLESVSYTRKDGQYLRWDHRSGRRQGSKIFDKGPILDFGQAIGAKLDEIVFDLRNQDGFASLFPEAHGRGHLRLFSGSCLDVMPTLPDGCYEAILTSPPYCNRYDYTRTHALELAMLGVGEEGLANLRQHMLSCTVENRAKDLLSINPRWQTAIAAADRQKLLQAILKHLENQKAQGALNNAGIPRMVRGYFYEMACVIAECARLLKPGAPLLMVNDNVRYAGASVSVDMILSDLARQLGFAVESILVLPDGKGNSSQQMGEHGRDPLRKCVYIWRNLGATGRRFPVECRQPDR